MKPITGSPIISVTTGLTLAYWTKDAPSMPSGDIIRVKTAGSAKALVGGPDKPEKDETFTAYALWREWSRPGVAHEVWLTDAEEYHDIRGMKGIKAAHEADRAADLSALRRVMGMDVIAVLPDYMRNPLESYARYLEARVESEKAGKT